MIQLNENITKAFNRKNILNLAFELSDTRECNELLMLLYKYQTLLEGRHKRYIEGLIKSAEQFKDARHFVTYLSKKPQFSRRSQQLTLEYLTNKPKTRFKRRIYHNSAALKVASRSNPFKGLPLNTLNKYLSKTTKHLLENKETNRRLAGRRKSCKRVHIDKKK